VDTDRTSGNGSTDSLFVDYMAITTVNPQPPLPTVTVTATDAEASESGDPGEFTISRNDTNGSLTVDYDVLGTATPGSDYVALVGSVTMLAGQATATIPVIPIDDDLPESTESVVIALAASPSYQIGSPSSATVAIADDDLVATDYDAISQSTTYGTVASGTLASARVDDDDYLQVSEQAYAGNKRTRLDHRWTFDIAGGSSATFFLQAHHTGTEDFMFSYSLNGTSWTNMIQVTKTVDDDSYQTFSLPSGVSGTVLIRVVDMDSEKFEPVVDSIFVDDFFIRVSP
jgi:hypothetical protein